MRTEPAIVGIATIAAIVGLGCDSGRGHGASPSASASAASGVASDDAKPPAALCARMTKLHAAASGAAGGYDPRACMAQFRSAREVRPDLYPCLSLCVMGADDFTTAARCTTMCAPVESTCEGAGDATAECEAKFKKLQADQSAKSFSCVAKCGGQQGMKAVVACMGSECGL